MAMATPTKCSQGIRLKSPESSSKSSSKKHQENCNPNLTSPVLKPSSSSSVPNSTGKSQKSASKNPSPSIVFPKKKIRDRKFVVAKKNNPKNQTSNVNCKCKEKINGKCLCVAYESLRASQEEFFKSRSGEVEQYCQHGGQWTKASTEGQLENKDESENQTRDAKENEFLGANEKGNYEPEKGESPKELGSSTIKRRRELLMEEARQSVPEPGSGRVLHLVKAFEKLLTIPKDDKEEEETKKGIKWALPGLQQPCTDSETQDFSSAFCPGELFFTAQSLGLDAPVSSSLDSARGSISSQGSVGSRRSRRTSGSFSSATVGGRRWKKKQQQHRVTSLRPFNLRTEQRGKAKEEEFLKRLHEMMIEEEKQRIPLAQGLPWTTDEPECLIKPAVKECTKPVDLKLHSDVRAVERAEFDHQVAEKMMLIEQYRMERERLQKLEEEEEIRRLRKELVPKAQPMPYFDRPFVPKKVHKAANGSKRAKVPYAST